MVQHTKNYFTRDRTTQAVIITKKRKFHTIKRRKFIVQDYFFDTANTIKKFTV